MLIGPTFLMPITNFVSNRLVDFCTMFPPHGRTPRAWNDPNGPGRATRCSPLLIWLGAASNASARLLRAQVARRFMRDSTKHHASLPTKRLIVTAAERNCSGNGFGVREPRARARCHGSMGQLGRSDNCLYDGQQHAVPSSGISHSAWGWKWRPCALKAARAVRGERDVWHRALGA